MKKQFIVIGLGRFGSSLVETLIQNKHEVLAVDKDLRLVEDMADIATHAVQADCTDEEVLTELGVQNFDHVIVAVGADLQTSILITLMLKEQGAAKVTAKAISEIQGKMLLKIGADHVVYPERDMGIRLGKQLSSENLVDYMQVSTDFDVVEFKAPKLMNNRTIRELGIRSKFACNIIAIKQNDDINLTPRAENIIRTGDILLIIGRNADLQRFEDKYE